MNGYIFDTPQIPSRFKVKVLEENKNNLSNESNDTNCAPNTVLDEDEEYGSESRYNDQSSEYDGDGDEGILTLDEIDKILNGCVECQDREDN